MTICPMCMEEHEPKIMWKKDKLLDTEYDYEYTYCEKASKGYETEKQFVENLIRWQKAMGELNRCC